MASPIRWDNVNAPDFSSSGRMLEASGQQMGNAIASLKGILNTTNQVEQANWENQRTNTTNGALAKIMSFADPNALADAQNSGLYQQLIGDGSVPIDQKAVMAALDSRGQLLENRGVASINYENAMTDKAQEGNRQQALMHLLNGNMPGFKQAVAGVRDPASLVTAGLNQQHYADQQKQAQAAFDLKKSLIDAQITLTNAKANDPDNFALSGSGGKGGSGSGKGSSKPELSDEAATAYLSNRLDKEGNPYMAPYSLEKFSKYVKEHVADDRMRQGILGGVAGLDARGFDMGEGKFVAYPQGVLEQAAVETAANPDFFSWTRNNTYPDRFKAKADEIMKRQGTRERMQEAREIQDALNADPIARQEVAKKLGMRLPDGAAVNVASQAADVSPQDSLALFMNNGRVRDFASGGYRDAVPADPRVAPAANQTPRIPPQATPMGLTYNQLMGGTDPKKGMSANPPISTPLISKEDKPSASVGLSLGASGNITDVHPDAIKIPEVTWGKPQVVQQAAPGMIPKGGGDRAVVTYVGDGDGAKLLKADGSTLDCRIDKIDAPEVAHSKYGKEGQPYGEEAAKTLQELIANKEVTVRKTQPPPGKNYGRSLCQIEVEGKDVSTEMIRAGAAWLYRRYSNDPVLSKLEREAKADKRGLWNALNPEYPENFKRRMGY